MTGTTANLHLVVYGEALGTIAKILGPEPRFLLQKATKLSIPIWVLTSPTLDQLEVTAQLPRGSEAATTLRHWFRRNYDAAWAKLLAFNARQDELDLGPASDELQLSDKKS